MRRTGLRLFTAAALLSLVAGAVARAESSIVEHYPGAAFETITPEAAG